MMLRRVADETRPLEDPGQASPSPRARPVAMWSWISGLQDLAAPVVECG